MLDTMTSYENLDAFRQAHPGVPVAGDGFFTHQTREQLQKIIDQTLTSLKKKRELTGPRAAVAAADALLKQASSAQQHQQVMVRWGVHQPAATGARGGGVATTPVQHFTVKDPAGGNDWHLTLDKNLQTILELSHSAGAVVRVANV